MTWGSILPPQQDTPTTGPRTLVVAAGSWNSIATIKSSLHQSVLLRLHPQAPRHLELFVRGCFFITLVVTHETRDVCATSQGVLTDMLESQYVPELCKGRKISATVCGKCPSTPSFGYSTKPNSQQKIVCPSVSCHNSSFASLQPSPFALVHDGRPPESSPKTLTKSPHR